MLQFCCFAVFVVTDTQTDRVWQIQNHLSLPNTQAITLTKKNIMSMYLLARDPDIGLQVVVPAGLFFPHGGEMDGARSDVIHGGDVHDLHLSIATSTVDAVCNRVGLQEQDAYLVSLHHLCIQWFVIWGY